MPLPRRTPRTGCAPFELPFALILAAAFLGASLPARAAFDVSDSVAVLAAVDESYASLAAALAPLGADPATIPADPQPDLSPRGQVQSMYIAYYGRAADPAGLDYWTGRLIAEGGSLDAIVDAFGFSREYLDRFGGLDEAAMVDTFYRQTFNRPADSGGLAYYLEELRTGRRTLANIAKAIWDGARNQDLDTVANKSWAADYLTGLAGGQRPEGDYLVLAANDLGMHCADLDYQVFSILPPFNVVHAQVLRKGATPAVLGPAEGVEVLYHATSSPCDPVHADPDSSDGTHVCDESVPPASWSINTTSQNAGGVFKTNFWDPIAYTSEANPDARSHGFDAYGPLFFGLLSPGAANVVGVGLPVPESVLLPECLPPPFASGSANCAFGQAAMPGAGNPWRAVPRYDHDVNFFDALLGPLGLGAIVQGTHWWSIEGLPVLPVDDQGRTNAYPLFTVEARVQGSRVAGTDVVAPVASEADCQNCHVDPMDCNEAYQGGVELDPGLCVGAGMGRTAFAPVSLADQPPGATLRERLQNAAKLNILRLHDAKHATTLEARRPVQCSWCHYSPALDLAQAGPTDSAEATASAGLGGPSLPGTAQTSHVSMSRAMHHHHGSLAADPGSAFDPASNALFPAMPGPLARGFDETDQVLEATCYQCHPGKRTQCLRGAMASAGVVCQDCHGGMLQVGDDFTAGFPSSPGQADLTRRVPWAVEPGCQSCHVGDALDHPADTAGFLWDDASSPIRLLQAWRSGDPQARAIQAADSRFAENRVVNGAGRTVDLLYRLSTGHGGVMCEGCHGSTHAIWPNQNPFANDNVTARQLQGHVGTLIECTSCHEGDLGNTLDGPHGLHPVGGTGFADGGHEALAERDPDACRACHGRRGEGTVLSRAAADRSFTIGECEGGTLCPGGEVERFTVHLLAGEPVGCNLCHENRL